jgi:hypothetical protein
VWWCAPIISTLSMLKQENQEFEASLDNIVKPVSKKKQTKNSKA